MADENAPWELPPVLQFDPPKPVYRVEPGELEEQVVLEPLQKDELHMRMRVAIPHPWKPDEERFLPGTAFGEGDQFFVEIGQSFGVLEFHETGWQCVALVPRVAVSLGLLSEKLTKTEDE